MPCIYFIISMFLFFTSFHGIDGAWNLKVFEKETGTLWQDCNLYRCVHPDIVYMEALNMFLMGMIFSAASFVSFICITDKEKNHDKNDKGIA